MKKAACVASAGVGVWHTLIKNVDYRPFVVHYEKIQSTGMTVPVYLVVPVMRAPVSPFLKRSQIFPIDMIVLSNSIMRMTWRQFLLVLWATAAFTLLSVTDAFSTLPQRHVIPKTRTTVLNFKTSWSPSASRASISSTSRSAPSILFLSSSSFNDDKDDKTNRSSSSLSWRKKLSLKGFNKSNDVANSLFSAFLLVLLDVAFRRGFRHYAIDFPSSLAGCGALLATLLIAPPKLASRLYDTLAPGSKLLAKWLSVFFVPSLITLPLLTEGAGSATEVSGN
jgi:hypothetical protein